MEELSKGELFPKVVEAYSRPTRIVRGKEIDFHTEVSNFFPLFFSIASLSRELDCIKSNPQTTRDIHSYSIKLQCFGIHFCRLYSFQSITYIKSKVQSSS
jgi:hypothetical protein